jgi:hypothetical protein
MFNKHTSKQLGHHRRQRSERITPLIIGYSQPNNTLEPGTVVNMVSASSDPVEFDSRNPEIYHLAAKTRPTSPIASARLTKTGRRSKVVKGMPVYHCECGKTYTRAEHLRRHQQNHKAGAFECNVLGCGRAFYREDLLGRHKTKHNDSCEPLERSTIMSAESVSTASMHNADDEKDAEELQFKSFDTQQATMCEWNQQFHEIPVLAGKDNFIPTSLGLAKTGDIGPSLIQPFSPLEVECSDAYSPQIMAYPLMPDPALSSTSRSRPSSFEKVHGEPHLHANAYQPYPANSGSRRPSISSIHPRHSQGTSANSYRLYPTPESSVSSDQSNKGLCPYPTCGRHFRDLKAHMLTHQNERPEKCPIPTCEYYTRGFARKYDQNRHLLTHHRGILVCGFCSGFGGSVEAEKSFNRADVFKRHLTSVHGVEQTPPNARRKGAKESKRSSYSNVRDISGMCSTCSATFANAQTFYEHLDDCVIYAVQHAQVSEAGCASEQDHPDEEAQHQEAHIPMAGYHDVVSMTDMTATPSGRRESNCLLSTVETSSDGASISAQATTRSELMHDHAAVAPKEFESDCIEINDAITSMSERTHASEESPCVPEQVGSMTPQTDSRSEIDTPMSLEVDEPCTTTDLFARAEADLRRFELGIRLLEQHGDSACDIISSAATGSLAQVVGDCGDNCQHAVDQSEEMEGDSSDRTTSCAGASSSGETTTPKSPNKADRETICLLFSERSRPTVLRY